jgi:predicted nucleic acid-binding protein
MRFIAIYDACVLYPAPVRDLLLEVAGAGLITAKWTKEIEAEWIRNLHANRPEIPLEILQETADRMIEFLPDCLVTNYEKLTVGLALPDENDKHVLAAAIKSHAQAIITFNLKDFPEKVLQEFDMEPIHPDTFLINQFDLRAGVVVSIAQKIRISLKKPPMTARQYLDNLTKVGLPAFSQRIEEFIDVI